MQIASDELVGGYSPTGIDRGMSVDVPHQQSAEHGASVDTLHTELSAHSEIDLRPPALQAAAKALADDLIEWADRRAAELLHQAEATAAVVLEIAEMRARAVTEEAEADVAAAEARLSELEALAASAEAVNEEAAVIRSRAEDAAAEILDQAWTTAALLQEEMLQEAEDHSRELMRQAEERANEVFALERSNESLEPVRAPGASEPIRLAHAADVVDPTPAEDPDQRAEAGSGRLRRRARRLLPRPATALKIVVPLVIALLVVRAFVFAPYSVSSSSMEPTLADGERVLVNKLDYRASQPRRGDIVVIEAPPGRTIGDELVKRVVALEGETVEASDGSLKVNGVPLAEHYLPPGTTTPSFGPIDVADGYVFVAGDNRATSIDSRSFGPIPVGTVAARVDAVIWPLSAARVL